MTSKEKIYGKLVADKVFFIKKLDSLGLDKTYTGYFMLVDIMDLLINKNMDSVSFSKDIYPIIAKIYNKKVGTVERNIRNLIDKCWSISLMDKLKFYLPEGQKPTCKDFIFRVKHFIIDQVM